MKSLKLLSILLCFCAAPSIPAFSQQLVKGVINYSANGKPAEGVNIILKNSDTHTHSNRNGEFSLKLLFPADTLIVSHIGYQLIKLPVIASQEPLKISLVAGDINLGQVTVTAGTQALNQLVKTDLLLNPVSSSQEILRKVPGLFISQHAGGGKAEQIFLRGFDVDHGTDVQITADGMPVNMVSHAHGQGYADLHFVIPETVRDVDFGKGAYYADKGDFNTAGYANFSTFDHLDKSSIKTEIGQFNTIRTVALIDLLGSATQATDKSAYIAGEYYLTDGPFDHPQNFNRLNLFGKYTQWLNSQTYLTLQGSTFSSKWDASGQVPLRAIEEGIIPRFGAIDPTEGGLTHRTNLSAKLQHQLSETEDMQSQFYYINYDFSLFSNFTFFLNDPVYGDQIHQQEQRNIYGFNHEYTNRMYLTNSDITWKGGLGFRYDDINDIRLSHTYQRKNLLDTYAAGDIDETNLFAYASAEWKTGNFTINPGARLDHFIFNYTDALEPTYRTQDEQKTIVSPKLNFFYSPNQSWNVYLKTGMGYHSNDTRVVVAQNGADILPRSVGADLGTIFKPTPQLVINAAVWYLYLQQEFVYVGDEAVVEPSGKTRRVGADLGLRYQPLTWLYFDADVNLAHPRALDAPDGEDYIPLAPTLTSTGGVAVQLPGGMSGSLRYRYVKDRPANEDNSLTAEGYTVADLTLNYTRKRWEIGAQLQNLFDTDWREAQFETETRLQQEPEPVTEIHFTPGMPFFAKGHITFFF
ncbi:MAG TPA: TonB-dependent receptor plug domain-containing protein [Pontibacter sp.]